MYRPSPTVITLAACLLSLCLSVARAQPSVVRPGPHFTLSLNGAPFYPLGWNTLGSCSVDDPEVWKGEALRADLERLREFGVNATYEPSFADGRLIPLRLSTGYVNWYSYRATKADGRTGKIGHPRPGPYVAGLRRYMDLAYADGQAPIYTFVSLSSFVTPQGVIPPEWSQPYAGSDTLRCEEYSRYIETERSSLRAGGEEDLARRVPPVHCPSVALPFWEWNLRYVVQSLRDHPGLLGWYLWDEPEDISHRHFFGRVPPETPVPAYTGPQSLPTPDLLRHAYDRVVAFEVEGQSASYQRHPVLVDVANPYNFFSERFYWSRDGQLRPRTTPGPFDRTPEGTHRPPADILGLEASASMVYTEARGDHRAQRWFQDQNDPVWRAALLREAVEAYDLWSGLVIAGQAQLSSVGPYRIEAPTRCPGYVSNVRPLNDRDLVWHLLSLQINGMRGQLYFSHHLTPQTGPGAQQADRTNRLIHQFREAGFDRLFAEPPVERGWALRSIAVETLTDYFRSDPDFVGPASGYDPGPTAARSVRRFLDDPNEYAFGLFGRSDAPETYGQATLSPAAVREGTEGLRLLRTAVRQTDEATYLFVSNIYDARITAAFRLNSELTGWVEEGRFDLNPQGSFRWQSPAPRVRTSRLSDQTLDIELEPYEARVFRLVR
jgi:hypothetical protein